MKTTAISLISISAMTPKIHRMNLIKSRMNGNSVFARNLMEKYKNPSDSEFPPASFVFFENNHELENQDDKGRILSLLLQIIHTENKFQNSLFQNMIYSNITAEVEYRLEQMKYTSAKDYREFTNLFRDTVRLVKAASVEHQTNNFSAEHFKVNKMHRQTGTLVMNKKELKREFEKQVKFYRRTDKTVLKVNLKEPAMQVTTVEKQFYNMEREHIDFHTLSLKDRETGAHAPKWREKQNEKQSEKQNQIQRIDAEKKYSVDHEEISVAQRLKEYSEKPIEKHAQNPFGKQQKGKLEEYSHKPLEKYLQEYLLEYRQNNLKTSRHIIIEKYQVEKNNGKQIEDKKKYLDSNQIDTQVNFRKMKYHDSPLKHNITENERDEAEKRTIQQSEHNVMEWEKQLLEKQLQTKWREIYQIDDLPSVKRQKLLQYLETISEEEQQQMAFVLGIERKQLIDRLRNIDNQDWQVLEQSILSSLTTFKNFRDEKSEESRKEDTIVQTENLSVDHVQKSFGKQQKGKLEEYRHKPLKKHLQDYLLEYRQNKLKTSRHINIDEYHVKKNNGEQIEDEKMDLDSNQIDTQVNLRDMKYHDFPVEHNITENERHEAEERMILQREYHVMEREKQLLERQLQKKWRDIYQIDYLPSVKGRKLLQYLETISEEEQQQMAFVLGMERKQLIDRLRNIDNQDWQILEQNILSSLTTFKNYQDGKPEESLNGDSMTHTDSFEVDLNEREAFYQYTDFMEHIEEFDFLQWKYNLSEWVGFLEPDTWDTLTDVVLEYEENIPQPMLQSFREKDKTMLLQYFQETESMEELFPFTFMVYREERLQEMAKEWLPGMKQFVHVEEVIKSQKEMKNQEFINRQELIKNRELVQNKSIIKSREFIEDLEGNTDIAPASKHLQGTKLFAWKQNLMEWISFLDMHIWEILTETVEESTNMLVTDMKETFKTQDKNAVIAYLSNIESMEELFPLLRLVQQEVRLQKEVSEWFPEITTLTQRQALVHQVETELTSLDLQQKRQLIQQWVQLLEDEEWSYMETDALSLIYRKEENAEREEYLHWLEQLSLKQKEELLIPVARIIYKRQEAAVEGTSEVYEMKDVDSEKLLQEEIYADTIWNRIRRLEEHQFQELVELTLSEMEKELFLNHFEKLSTVHQETILTGVTDLLYQQSDIIVRNQQQAEQKENTVQNRITVLREEIKKNEIQNRIRSLESKHWETVKKRISFSVTKEDFLKEVEKFHSEEEIATVMHQLQKTHRIFYHDKKEHVELNKNQEVMSNRTDTEQYRKSMQYLKNYHRTERKIEEQLETDTQREVQRLHKQAVHQWTKLINLGLGNRSGERSTVNHTIDKTFLVNSIQEEEFNQEYTQTHRKYSRIYGTDDLNTAISKKKYKIIVTEKSAWIPSEQLRHTNSEENFFYDDAQIIISRSPRQQGKEMRVTPVADIEEIVDQVKAEAIKDIHTVKRTSIGQGIQEENTTQWNHLLKQISSQQKEMEQMKQVQARLIQKTDMNKITETVMKQFNMQLRTEKLRRGL